MRSEFTSNTKLSVFFFLSSLLADPLPDNIPMSLVSEVSVVGFLAGELCMFLRLGKGEFSSEDEPRPFSLPCESLRRLVREELREISLRPLRMEEPSFTTEGGREGGRRGREGRGREREGGRREVERGRKGWMEE